MKRVIDSVSTVIVLIVVIAIILNMLKPYLPFLVIGLVLVFLFERVIKHYQNW